MKKHFNKSIVIICMLMVFAACKKNEATITYSGQATPSVLTATVANGDTIPLNIPDSLNGAIVFSWTNPNYVFSNGISSLNVNYNLEIDTVGSNFTNPNLIQIGIPSALGDTFTVSDLNFQLFGNLRLQTGVPHNIAVRIVSSLNDGSLPLYSNTLNFIVTPYAIPPKVNPPSSGDLYITGAATNDGWMVAGDVTTVGGQQMTLVPGSNGLIYTITISLTGGQQFLVVPVAGDWGNKYATADGSGGSTSGGTFALNAANNFNAPATTGTYTVTFNFQTGVYTITH